MAEHDIKGDKLQINQILSKEEVKIAINTILTYTEGFTLDDFDLVYKKYLDDIIASLDLDSGGGSGGAINTGTVTQEGNQVTLSDYWRWRINGGFYEKSTPQTFPITLPDSGNIRIDLIVGNNNNEFVYVQGTQTTGSAVAPNIPNNTVGLVTVFSNDSGITGFEEFALSAFVRFDVNSQNLTPINRQNARTNIQAVSLDTDESITGSKNFTKNIKVNTVDIGLTVGSSILVGLSALRMATSGGHNSAFGTYALEMLTNADNNTAIGYSALRNTNGDGNVGVGNNSLRDNTTGIDNTAIGTFAQQNNTLGRENVAVGDQALLNNLEGIRNVVVGAECGRLSIESLPVTDISNSILIGNFVRTKNPTGVINEIAIGHRAHGNGSNTVVIGNGSITSVTLAGTHTAPETLTSPGVRGEIRITPDFIYVCVGANIWKTISLGSSDEGGGSGGTVTYETIKALIEASTGEDRIDISAFKGGSLLDEDEFEGDGITTPYAIRKDEVPTENSTKFLNSGALFNLFGTTEFGVPQTVKDSILGYAPVFRNAKTQIGDVSHYDIMFSDGVFIGTSGSGNRIYRSLDGSNFVTVPNTTFSMSPISITKGGGCIMVVGLGSTSGVNNAIRSFDNGLTWDQLTTPAGISLRDVTFGEGIFWACGNGIAGSGVIYTTDFGDTWLLSTTVEDNDYRGIVYYAGDVYLSSRTGTNRFFKSTDKGASFAVAAAGNFGGIWDRGFVYNDRLIFISAGAATNKIIYSDDKGATFITVTNGDNNGQLYAIKQIGIWLWTVGQSGAVRRSLDGINWELYTQLESPLSSIAGGNIYGAPVMVTVSSSGTGNRIRTSLKSFL